MPKGKVTTEQQREIYERDGGSCVICDNSGILDVHHCYKKSEYFEQDRDDNWNLALLCRDCHSKVHGGDREIDKGLKQMALKRYQGENEDKLRSIYKSKGYE